MFHQLCLPFHEQSVLLAICLNAFSNAFSSGFGLNLSQTAALLTLLPILHLLALAAFFTMFSLPAFGFARGDVVAAMFCSSHKTLAFGLPLIQTIFKGNANLAAFCAPIMFIFPLQLTLGSILLPAISRYINKPQQ
jgi:sodium/bile acid cotransporter 7